MTDPSEDPDQAVNGFATAWIGVLVFFIAAGLTGDLTVATAFSAPIFVGGVLYALTGRASG
jgi:hypothetical protein